MISLSVTVLNALITTDVTRKTLSSKSFSESVSSLLQIRRKTFSKSPALICSGIDGSGSGDSSCVGSLCSLMPTFCLLSSELTVAMFLIRPQISNPCYNTEEERARVCVCVCVRVCLCLCTYNWHSFFPPPGCHEFHTGKRTGQIHLLQKASVSWIHYLLSTSFCVLLETDPWSLKPVAVM